MTTNDIVRQAGGSQRAEAAACRERAREYARLQQLELDLARRHEAGGRGEASVAATLQALTVYGWHVLVDRQWPRSAGNIDLVLAGPGGVVIVDVKTWSEVRVEGGRLYRGDADQTDELDTLSACASPVVAEALATIGYSPTGIVTVAVLAGRRLAPTQVSTAVVLGEGDIAQWLRRRGDRLDAVGVARLVTELEQSFPPHEASGRRVSATRLPAPRPRPQAVEETEHLFDVEDLAEADRVAAAAGPIEQWMTWLHPDQAPLVRRTFNGPARLSGPAGTGKTVVALHRAALAAQQPGSRVLLTSFVATLPVVLQTLLTRLAPQHADRVQAQGVHAWAMALLRQRGVRHRVDVGRIDTAFGEAWSRVGRNSALAHLPLIPLYWQEEIDTVIKGRGIDTFEDYAALDRVGRRTPLQREHRAAVWDLYCAYQGALQRHERHDFADVVRLARDELRRTPLEEPFTSVVVDEVQDLSMVGVQLLHELVGDRTDGLLLVGDSTQAIYPGGFRLSEAGIAVVGRSVRLGTNYRNGAAILAHATTVAATPSDLDEGPGDTAASDPHGDGVETVSLARAGGRVAVVEAGTGSALETALLEALRSAIADGVAPGDCGVLVPSNSDAARWVRLLAGAGLPSLRLTQYRGDHVDAVKVGTVHRAKGLEFGHVVVVDADPLPPRRSGEADDAYAERAETWKRRVYVAMTRARDTLWCGRVVGHASRR